MMNRISSSLYTTLPCAQRGMATLLISLVILTTITFTLIYSARTVLMEQNITANDLRGRQAFEAAEAGQEAAVAYLMTPGGRDKDGDGRIVTYVHPSDSALSELDEFLFDTTHNGTNDSNTLTMPNGSRLTVEMFEEDQKTKTSSYVATRIRTQGWSDDGTATRTINHVYSYVSPLPNVPENPVLARGTVVVNGSATVINPEGHSTIWSGLPVDLGGNAATATMIADPSITTDGAHTTAYPQCLGSTSLDPENCSPTLTNQCPCEVVMSSDRGTPGLDIVEQDDSLKNLAPGEFFMNFFGTTEASYKNTRVTLFTTGANSDQDAPTGVNLATSEVAWVDATGVKASWNGLTVGCSVAGSSNNSGMYCNGNIQPSIVIVDGDLSVKGNIMIWGLLYVKGNITGTGSVDVRGAMMMEGDNGNLGGSLRLFYNSAVLRSLSAVGQMGGGGGSWRDFE